MLMAAIATAIFHAHQLKLGEELLGEVEEVVEEIGQIG